MRAVNIIVGVLMHFSAVPIWYSNDAMVTTFTTVADENVIVKKLQMVRKEVQFWKLISHLQQLWISYV